MTLTYVLFSIVPPMTFQLLFSFSPYLAPGRCFRSWVLIAYQFYKPSLFRPNERLPSFNFQKARLDDFAFYFDSHCSSAEEYSCLFLSSAAVLFTSPTLSALVTIWCSGQIDWFLPLLAKTALANACQMPNAKCSHCGIEATLFFSPFLVC